jgi:RNA polymerase sigma-70 factor (ECF subfamily)
VQHEALERFLAALEHGDLAQVQHLLAADVASYSDGGGRARAARRVVRGADQVVQYVTTLRRHLPVGHIRRVDVNGRPAATLWFGRQFAVLALDVRGDKIREIHWVMNPDKLRYLQQQLAAGGPALPGAPA